MSGFSVFSVMISDVFQCNARMLVGLGMVNLLMIIAAAAGMASGGIGIRCESNREADGSCTSFAKEIACKQWSANATQVELHIAELAET